MRKKKVENPRQLTAQEFTNVEDIAGSLIYSVDGYLFGSLILRAGDGKLLSEHERVAEAGRMAAALAGETEPWQLLSVPRTVDTLGMIRELAAMRRQTDQDARLKLINGEIAALQEMAREGTKEPLIILKCWTKAARGADKVLINRLQGLRKKLTELRVSAEIMTDVQLTYLCKVFGDLSTFQNPDEEEFDEELPILEGQARRFTLKGEEPTGSGLLSLITPVGGLSFGVSKVVAGSVLARVYAALRFPSELDYGWAVELMNSSDCVTGITYYPGNIYELGNALSRSIKRGSVDAAAESDARRRKHYERQVQDADQLIDELDAKNSAIGHISLLVMPFSNDEEGFEETCQNVVSRYGKKRITLKSLGGLQKEAFKHISPYHISQPKVESVAKQIMPLETLMGGSPMTVSLLRDDGGYYFARTMDGGIISLNLLLRGRDRTNGNIVATGTSGSGKSTALKSIIMTLYMAGVKIIIIDPEREFRELAQKLDGAWLDVGGGAVKSNFLQIRPVPEDDPEEADGLYRSNDNAMALHIQTLDVMFKLYLPSLTDLQRALLKKALADLYQEFHITWSTDVAGLAPQDFPTARDLYQLLVRKADEDAQYKDLAALVYDMAEGADSFLWNGHTDIDLSNNFVCLDTKRLMNASDELKRALYFNNLTMCWEEISRDRSQPVFLLCDEAHILLDPEIREPAKYLRNLSKRVRKYEGMLGVVLQSVVDALYEKIRLYGQALLDNAAYKLLFATDGKNLKETADTFLLTEAEQSLLLGAPRGRALCLIGQQHVCVDFDIPQYKLDLMGSGGGR